MSVANGDAPPPPVKAELTIPADTDSHSVASSVPESPVEPSPEELVRQQQAKYKHIFAIHARSRTSTLSHDAETTPSFIGFRNLMVLVLIVGNLRLVVENYMKYGVLITLAGAEFRRADITTGLMLYCLVPVHLFVGFLIELIAAAHARGAEARNKKTDNRDPKLRAAWALIAFAHTVNATLCLGIATAVVYWGIHHPLIGSLCQFHAVVVWLKQLSYAFTNRDLRDAFLEGIPPPELYRSCPYPTNISLSNLCYFWWAPTLVYQPAYPRSPSFRWPFFLKRVGETLALSIAIWFLSAQYAAPVLKNSIDALEHVRIPVILERLMKLSTISVVIWLAGFFALFQSSLNALAELLRFGDREFYTDWWNSASVGTYWKTWNKPVYHFMARHVYMPLQARGWSRSAASCFVFTFSAFLHEILVGVPTHNIIGVAFAGMMFQIPLIAMTMPFERAEKAQRARAARKRREAGAAAGSTQADGGLEDADPDEEGGEGAGATGVGLVGNAIFWISFCLVGQPFAALLYYFSWQVKYGGVVQKTGPR